MMDALLRDDRLRWDLAQLASNLDQLMPDGLGERYEFSGDEPLGLEAALEQIGRAPGAGRAGGRSSTGVETPGDLAGARPRARSRELLGDDAARDLDALDELAQQLEEAGYLSATAIGWSSRRAAAGGSARRSSTTSSRGSARRVRRPSDRPGRAWRRARGDARSRTSSATRSISTSGARSTNALRREENAPRRCAGGRAVRLRADDFEVYRTEQLTRTSTVLLVDMSRSMLLRGCFVAAKKVAVALDTLIRTQYPHDDLSVIGFAYYARELRPEALAELTWHGYEYGTNLQHGLMLARRILAGSAAANQPDRGDHRRRADRPLRERPGRVQLPADAADDPGDAPRGPALHPRRDHDQHVHARAVAGAGRVRRPDDPDQPRPGLLRDARSAWASTCWSTSSHAGPVGGR